MKALDGAELVVVEVQEDQIRQIVQVLYSGVGVQFSLTLFRLRLRFKNSTFWFRAWGVEF